MELNPGLLKKIDKKSLAKANLTPSKPDPQKKTGWNPNKINLVLLIILIFIIINGGIAIWLQSRKPSDNNKKQTPTPTGTTQSNQVELSSPSNQFYYPNLVSTDLGIWVSLADNKKDIFMQKISFDLQPPDNQINLTENIKTKSDQEIFSHHQLIYFQDNFYGVFRSQISVSETGLYLAKFDSNFNLTQQIVIGYYGPAYQKLATKNEKSDYPTIKVINEKIYILNPHYNSLKSSGELQYINGGAINVFDLDLELIEKYSLYNSRIKLATVGDFDFDNKNQSQITGINLERNQITSYIFDQNKEFQEEETLLLNAEISSTLDTDNSNNSLTLYGVPYIKQSQTNRYTTIIALISQSNNGNRYLPFLIKWDLDDNKTISQISSKVDLKVENQGQESSENSCSIPGLFTFSPALNFSLLGISQTKVESCSLETTVTDQLFLIKSEN